MGGIPGDVGRGGSSLAAQIPPEHVAPMALGSLRTGAGMDKTTDLGCQRLHSYKYWTWSKPNFKVRGKEPKRNEVKTRKEREGEREKEEGRELEVGEMEIC